ncbi:MAG: hypothetical protein JWO36_1091 [Myxococcales bacterium]|nr:hypothetical protein [Myxococcales bacterium]
MKLFLLLAALAGCAASSALPPTRFVNAPPVAVVDDRGDMPKPLPADRFYKNLYVFDSSIERRTTRALRLPSEGRALAVNAIDEVPDSTWFTNRIGTRALSPDEIATGPMTEGPEQHLPWTVVSTKVGGTSFGLIIRDARGVKYELKFDANDAPPELETGAHVVVNRLVWAAGYNVPDDRIVYIRRGDLVLAPDAVVKDIFGEPQSSYRRDDLDRDLQLVHVDPDGRIRVLASRWIDGKVVHSIDQGVREGDPNDRIPHERRRDLRGASPIFAWVNHADANASNFLDAWVADPADPRRHYLEHYAIDFGRSLGVMEEMNHDRRPGYAYNIDPARILSSLFILGIAPRPWEGGKLVAIRGVARGFRVALFDPGQWRPCFPYTPFVTADRFDNFWGAKIIARFTPAQIRSAVLAGQFTDPRAVDYLTDTLVARARVTEAYWFARVNPLDQFVIAPVPAGASLCFDDLSITAGLDAATTTRYTVTAFDRNQRPLGAGASLAAAPAGRTCTMPVTLSTDHDGYTILDITTTRPGFTGSTLVHLARDPSTQMPRVIGIWRL